MFSKTTKVLLIFALFFFFVSLLWILIKESSHTTLLAFEEGSTESILRVKTCFYGCYVVFSQVLCEFLFVAFIYYSFFNHKKIEWRQIWMHSYRGICYHKLVGCLDASNSYLMVVISSQLFVFKNSSKFFKFAVFCSCLIVTEPYYGVERSGPISFLVNYRLFCLASLLSDAVLTLLIKFLFKKCT